MRLHILAAARILAVSIPLVFAAASLPLVAQSAPGDRAYSLIGTWSCKGETRGKGTLTFTQNPDGSIALKNTFKMKNGQGERDEQFRFDSQNSTWTWTATRPDAQDTGTAGAWTASDWTFEGTRRNPDSNTSEQIRMVYTALSDGSIRRHTEEYQNGAWVVRSGSICRRT
jgi:hypothetical protein